MDEYPSIDDEELLDFTDPNTVSLEESLVPKTTIEPASFTATIKDSLPGRWVTPDYISEGVRPELIVSSQRRKILLGNAPNTPNSDIVVVRHMMHYVIRVLRSWPRMMALHYTANLPPVIHRLQLADSMPTPLVNCYTLAKMWAGQAEGSSELVQTTILREVRRLLSEVILPSTPP